MLKIKSQALELEERWRKNPPPFYKLQALSLCNIQLVAEIKREQKTIQKWCLVPPVNRDEFLVKSKPKKIIKPRRLWKGHHSDQF